jgi:hypothetical protein
LLRLESLLFSINIILALIEFLKDLLIGGSSSYVETYARGWLMSLVGNPIRVSVFIHISKIVVFKIFIGV